MKFPSDDESFGTILVELIQVEQFAISFLELEFEKILVNSGTLDGVFLAEVCLFQVVVLNDFWRSPILIIKVINSVTVMAILLCVDTKSA